MDEDCQKMINEMKKALNIFIGLQENQEADSQALDETELTSLNRPESFQESDREDQFENEPENLLEDIQQLQNYE